MIIYCDHCKEDLSIESNMRKTVNNNVRRKFLYCNNCSSEYDIIYEDDFTDTLQNQIKKEYEELMKEGVLNKPSHTKMRLLSDSIRRYKQELDYYTSKTAKTKYWKGKE